VKLSIKYTNIIYFVLSSIVLGQTIIDREGFYGSKTVYLIQMMVVKFFLIKQLQYLR